MKTNRDKFHLNSILESISTINDYIVGYDYDRFIGDKKTYDAVLMQFVNMGETINRLSETFHEKHGDLPWHKAVGMRNEIAHGYLDVKPVVVWKTAVNDLPKLKKDIDNILK